MPAKNLSTYLEQPIIETERLILRSFDSADLPAILNYASHPDVARYTTWTHHKTEADSQVFLDFIKANQSKEMGKIFFIWAITKKRKQSSNRLN